MDAKLITEYIGHKRGRAQRKLERDFRVRMKLAGLWWIVVPAGFVTDYASIPRFFWRILPPDGPYLEAAVVHDYLYSTDCDRLLADAVFRVLMKRLGIPWWKRVVMFYAVRIFGGLARRRAKA